MRLATFIMGSISLLIQQYADDYKATDLSKTLNELAPDRSLPRIETYDFIVVGGGTAGCLVAGRLSEKFKVLLLENGGTPVPATFNPFLTSQLMAHPAINQFFYSVPQHNFTLEDNGISESSTGKMLGGSGSHNGNVYNRGSPRDYDNFAKLTGDETWKYKNVLKYFKSIENFVGKLVTEKERGAFYGVGGPLTVDTDTPPILNSWFEAGQELGFMPGDPNGNQRESFTPIAKSVKNGERDSTYTAFIMPHESTRKSLTVLRYSNVEQILINKDNVAYGVRYKRHGIPQIAHASKEVIISCGTFSSPLLLMKSGVGPKEILESAKITVKKDLPGVGRNLKDHAAVILGFTAYKPSPALLPRIDDEKFERDLNKYQKSRRQGAFTALDVGPQALLVSSRAKENGEGDWPDIQIVFTIKPLMGNDNEPRKIFIQTVINRLRSVGEIGFNSTAYMDGENEDTKLALVDHRLFTEESDVTVMVEAIKHSLKIMEETKPFQDMNVTYTESSPEACKNLEFRSDEYWKCYIRQRALSWLHVTGTNKMGMENDPMSVVDSKLRVRGIKNLRVVDASVMPQPTNVNTNAPTMLIAEKTAQEIIKEYKSEYYNPSSNTFWRP